MRPSVGLACGVLALLTMGRAERRARSRIRCGSVSVHATVGRVVHTALLADLSLDGVRLLGVDIPRGTWVSLSIIVPPLELRARGCVSWWSPRRHAVGIAFAHGSHEHEHNLGRAMLALAFEQESARPAAALFVDDPATTARLCEPLRRHGYVPRVITTPLEATACLDRPRPPVQLAIVSHRALGMSGAEVLAFLAAEYPNVARVAIDEPGEAAKLHVDEVLPVDAPDRQLETILTELEA